MKQNTHGFTIVELLIVIVVIGVLAAISIVAYNGVSHNARVSSAKSSLSQIAKQLEIYKLDNGTYPTSVNRSHYADILRTAAGPESTSAASRYIVCFTTSGASYAIAAWAPIDPRAGEPIHYISSATGVPSVETMTAVSGTTSATACGIIHPSSTMGASIPTWSQQL